MQYRELGRTGWRVSAVSFGSWAIGGSWGTVDEDEAMAALHAAVDSGVNFFDTADVYGDGRSERLLARLRRERSETIRVATKAGRRQRPHTAEAYIGANLARFVERSLEYLETDCLDLLQLHSPPAEVYDRPEVFAALDDLVRAGSIQHYGVSVESVQQGLKCLDYPGVQSIQIVFNMFRHHPADELFAAAAERRVVTLARVPVASVLLTGKMTAETTVAANDHRALNRTGSHFDVGETCSGVEFERGLRAVDELRALIPEGVTMAQLALRWILMFD